MSTSFSKTFEIPNRTEYLSQARDFVKEAVRASRLRPDLHNKVVLAIDEAISNIIEHAYDAERHDKIEIAVICGPRSMEVVIRDHGTHFDPGTIPEVDMEAHLKSRNKNGLGIFMIRQIMDEIEYSFKEGVENVLRLVKYYEENP